MFRVKERVGGSSGGRQHCKRGREEGEIKRERECLWRNVTVQSMGDGTD